MTLDIGQRKPQRLLEDLKVVVAHDYLTQRGGAERVVLAIMEAFPTARLITSVYNESATFEEYRKYRVETMWLNRIPMFRKEPRLALPLLAHAFSTYDVGCADVLVSSTSGWAHGLATSIPTVVYCHNPARWLYQTDEYFSGRLSHLRRPFEHASRPLRAWDLRSAHATSVYFANSKAVAERVASVYGIDAALLPPPAGLDRVGDRHAVPGLSPGFLLTISRARGYKNVELACEAVAGLPDQRLVVVGKLPTRAGGRRWPTTVTAVTGISDAQMRWLYSSCMGVMAVGREDFGLTPVEGFGFGKPAAVLRSGGYLDSGAPEVASVWINEATVEAARVAIRELQSRKWDAEAIRAHAERFSKQQFQERLQQAVLSVHAQARSPRQVHSYGVNRGRRFQDEASGVAGTSYPAKSIPAPVEAGPLVSVSIIVTSHNNAPTLRAAIESALRQTVSCQVVVVEDGSSDESAEIVASYGDLLFAIYQENAGQPAAFNVGFAAASGDVIVFLDSDDLIYPDAAETLLAAFSTTASSYIWFLEVIGSDGRPTGKHIPATQPPSGDLRDLVLRRGPGARVCPPTSGSAWSRSFLERALPLPVTLSAWPDGLLGDAAPLYGDVVRVDRVLGAYRVHDASTSERGKALTLANLERMKVLNEMRLAYLARHAEADAELWLRRNWRQQVVLSLLGGLVGREQPSALRMVSSGLSADGRLDKRVLLAAAALTIRLAPSRIGLRLAERLILTKFL